MNGQGSGQGGMGRKGQGGGQCGGAGMGRGQGGMGRAGSGRGGMGGGQGRGARFQAAPGAFDPASEALPVLGAVQDGEPAPETGAPEGQDVLAAARPGRCRRGMRAGLCRNVG